jgi:heme oxygenase
MLTGWMPKLPSCPIPLTYQNKQTEQICELLEKDKSYEIVYKGKRFINSVQLHKRYDYKWKYRERYEIKVNIITEAVNNVGLL